MQGACWADCRADFVFDGDLVDLIVPGTGTGEWESFWDALRAGPFVLRAFRDGEPIPLPSPAGWAFAGRREASVMVEVSAGTLTLHCHFFGGDLELDVDPRQVTSESAFESLLTAMRLVAKAVQRPGFATAEGGTPDRAFLKMSPDGRVDHRPNDFV